MSKAIPTMIQWRKSSYSGDQGGECVEVGELPATVAVRDSKAPAGPILTLAPAAFATFVGWARVTHK
ncbi:DUF397 domain-containing protein [Streptomyces coelicoflavus]|uniref:DUF397 domain-containing protein n=1 Tax=Streptomyces coelicoflavus TaxID=285562 RepID=UPI0035AB757D